MRDVYKSMRSQKGVEIKRHYFIFDEFNISKMNITK